MILELSVEAPGFSNLLTFEKNGYILAFLGLDDTFALVPDNPGASREVAEKKWNCEGEEKPDRTDIGLYPMRGFVPTYVFSNLVDRNRSYQASALSVEELTTRLLGGREQMKSYPEDTISRAPTWEELTAFSKSAESSSDSVKK